MTEQTRTLKLEAFGCYVWVEGGRLYECEINTFEAGADADVCERCNRTRAQSHTGHVFWWDGIEPGGEVTAPASQAFLDAVNETFGSEFKLEQFAGR
jgi:superoxide dismutase